MTEVNQGRQLFADTEVGLHKSVALINRINRFFGTNWKAVAKPFQRKAMSNLPNRGRGNIYISCVDTVSARFDTAEALNNLDANNSFDNIMPLYWMDMGNARNSGQVMLSTIYGVKQPKSKKYRTVSHLPFITEEFTELLLAEADNSEPSCSLAVALLKQDLFISPALADLGVRCYGICSVRE